MKILVIGGSGFIGSRLVSQLYGLGHSVSIFDKQQSALHNNITTIGDIRDQEALNLACEGFDCIVNLAAEHKDDVRPKYLYFDVNVNGAKNVVAAAKKNNINRIIFTSTVAVYGLSKGIANESSPINPFNDYGASKAQAEEVFSTWLTEDKTNRSLIILRPVVVFGEGNKGNVYNLINQVKTSKFLMIGRGLNTKSMAYVGNIVAFLSTQLTSPPGKFIFNYADKPDKNMKNLMSEIYQLVGLRMSKFSIPYPIGLFAGYLFDALAFVLQRNFPVSSIRVRKFCADTQVDTIALERTGFERPFSLSDGLKHMINAIKSQDANEWNDVNS